MRTKLGRYYKKSRKKYTAIVRTIVTKHVKGELVKFVVLGNVSRGGEVLADHLNVRSGFWSRELKKGDVICVEGTVCEYFRRNTGNTDYGLKDAWVVKNYGETDATTTSI